MKNIVLKEFLDAVKSKIPNYKKRMRGGCTEEDLIELEGIIKRKLPQTYKDLLLTFNGEQQEMVLLMGGFSLLSFKRVLREYEFVKTNTHSEKADVFQANLIQPYHYQRDRVSFADDGSGNFISIDYEPNNEGKEGQIIYFPLGEREALSVLFNDFDEYLQFMTKAIIDGRVKIEENDDDGKKTHHFVKTWKDNWTDIAEQFIQK
jgi:cell wall assembly regulator SMI1